jgi:hypothetical protein
MVVVNRKQAPKTQDKPAAAPQTSTRQEKETSSGGTWMRRGEAGLKRSQEIADERAKSYGPRRFFQKPGQDAKLILLDSDGVRDCALVA